MSNLEYPFYSKEIRWFFPKTPHKLDLWFKENRVFVDKDEVPRTDFYLTMRPHDNISYKIREGRTEIKLRLGESETIAFPNGHKGKAARWVKWSLVLKERRATPGLLYVSDKGSFIALTKQRKLITFEILPGKTVGVTNTNDLPDEGCQVELTSLTLNKKRWSSFALEAFGSKSMIDVNFNLVTDKVFGEISEPFLEEKDSFSYPEFLAFVDS